MRRLMVILTVLLCGGCSGGQPPPDAPPDDPEAQAVLAVVRQFFDTMRSRDADGARATLVVEGQFNSIRPAETGVTVRTTPLASYLEGLGADTRLQEERMWDPVVMVDEQVAMVWAPYDFHRDGELSHCGIDVFSLVRTGEGWKITGVTYSVEPDGCERLGQPNRQP